MVQKNMEITAWRGSQVAGRRRAGAKGVEGAPNSIELTTYEVVLLYTQLLVLLSCRCHIYVKNTSYPMVKPSNHYSKHWALEDIDGHTLPNWYNVNFTEL